ncbi:MAG: DUF1992 domain-containing protein [Burkholderiales bacterium]|nr:DUF1992 domain-containing protein [Burkholderiales bacterium]
MNSAFDRIAEERIGRAAAAGAFDDLPGAGRPLDLGDDLLVPPEVRMANRILKNAGCVPPELEAHAARRAAARGEAAAQRAARARLAVLEMRLETRAGHVRAAWRQYAPQLLKRFAGKA